MTPRHADITRSRARPTRGFSLIEAVIATLIVSILTVAALTAIPAVVEGRVRSARLTEALALAQDLMAEIDAQPWADPTVPTGPLGPGPAIGRAQFDDCDDYLNWSESPPQERDGTDMVGYDNWSRSVTVEFVSVSAPEGPAVGSSRLKRVTITVAFRGATLVRLVRLRSAGWDATLPEPSVNEPILAEAPLGATAP